MWEVDFLPKTRYNLTILIRGSSNGRTAGSGSAYQGSNPCPRAMFYVYCLISLKNSKRYIGYTSDLKKDSKITTRVLGEALHLKMVHEN